MTFRDPMKLYGLIGYPLSHSRSPEFFTRIFRKKGLGDRQFRLFPLKTLDELPSLVRDHPDLCGFNVTIPYKVDILPVIREIDPAARSIGAVNTVRVKRAGRDFSLDGYNTDAAGFERSLDLSPFSHALILGTGGGARAVASVLRKHGIDHLFLSRSVTGESIIPYKECGREMMEKHHLIINATPSGMFPDIFSFPGIPYHFLGPDHLLYDLVYNPEETEFMKKGRKNGARAINGLRMLELQAEEAFCIWEK